MYIRQGLAGEEPVFEDPDFQVTANIPPWTASDDVSGHVDLEKGNEFPARIVRKDSAMPRADEHSSAGGSSSSGN